jgi:hypothetical protein
LVPETVTAARSDLRFSRLSPACQYIAAVAMVAVASLAIATPAAAVQQSLRSH